MVHTSLSLSLYRVKLSRIRKKEEKKNEEVGEENSCNRKLKATQPLQRLRHSSGFIIAEN